MKKILSSHLMLALGISLSVLSPALAEQPAYPELKTASGFSRTLQNVTGFTPMSGWIANRILRKELGEHVQGKLKSKLTPFSGTDLLGRKAKRIHITGQNVLMEGFIPLSRFSFENKDSMPLMLSKGHHAFLLRPVDFNVTATMTEADINRMLQSEKAKTFLSNMKVKIPPFGGQAFDALEPSVTLDGDRVIIESRMNLHEAPPENALPVKVSGKIGAEKSALTLSDLDLQIEGIQDTEPIALVVENYFSELVDFKKLKVDRHRLIMRFNQTEIRDKELRLIGTLTIEPDPKALKKYLGQAAAKP